MRKFRKFIIPILIVMIFCIPIATNAYTGSYSFSINAQVKGTTKHSLKKKSTSTTARANTYYVDEILKTKDKYNVTLVGGLFKSYSTTDITANGSSYTRSFGTVDERDYTITVTKSTRNTYGATVKGNGTIKQ